MWGQIIQAGAGILGNIIGGAQARGGLKRAGTELYQSGQREAEEALKVPGIVNPMIQEAYQRAQGAVSGVGNRTADDITAAGTGANTFLSPYMQTGGEALTTLSQLAQAPEERFTGTDLEMDPGYQFRLDEGQKALERSRAATGSLQGGGTLKALTRYAQGAASQEYQNAFTRSLEGFKANQAARQQRLGTLSGLVSTGYGASGQAGANLINTGRTAGDWRNRAAELEAGYGIDSATGQAGNIIGAHNVARGLRLGADQARANSILGSSQITGDMWSGGGNTLSSLIAQINAERQGRTGGGGSTVDLGGYYNPWYT